MHVPLALCAFQLAEARQEVEAARGHSQQLQAQVEELQEEVSLQEARSYGDTSLLSELESSLEITGLGVSKEEVGLLVNTVKAYCFIKKTSKTCLMWLIEVFQFNLKI